MQLYFLLLFLYLMNYSSAQKAALILGGYWNQNTDGTVMNSAELFGCSRTPIRIANLTKTGYLMAGIYREDLDDVLVCGGYNCAGSVCGIEATCQTWNPRSKIWDLTDVPRMNSVRGSHLMARGPNLNTENNAPNPIAVGYTQTTEIYDWATNAWSNYRDLPERNWNTQGCLYQDHDDQGYIYNVRTNITRLDVNDWSVADLGTVPQAFVAPGRCTSVTIGGNRGLFIRHGYFYDFNLRTWFTKTPPPRNPIALAANSMFSFNGRPTIFGNPKCNNHGVCEDVEVVQYVPDSDTWITLGDMSRARTYHEVVEVPGSWCDYFVSTTTTVTTITTSTTIPTISATNTVTTTTTSVATNQMGSSIQILASLVFLAFCLCNV